MKRTREEAGVDAGADGAGDKPAAKKTTSSNLFDKSMEHINASKDKVSAAKAVLNKYGDDFTKEQRTQLESIARLAETLS